MGNSLEVCILMATYNGAEYIRTQIDSIIGQTFQNWTLIIRDDGSTDSTIGIIDEYISRDARIHLQINQTGKRGAHQNFWELVQTAKEDRLFDYYFFCDQDDVWEADKIEVMIRYETEHAQAQHPTLTYSDMSIIDAGGHW